MQISASDALVCWIYALILTGSSMTHLLTLYFMDSGAYSKGYLDWFGYFFPTEYDWIHSVGTCTPRQSLEAKVSSLGPNRVVPPTIWLD